MARTALGLALHKGVLYSFGEVGGLALMWRHNAFTGQNLDAAGVWLTSGTQLMQWVAGPPFNSQMAIGAEKIGIVTQDGINGLRIRLLDRATGVAQSTTVINATTNLDATDICADGGDNFYVAWEATNGQPNRLSKYNSSGVHQWTHTASDRVYGVAFDRIHSRLYCVGTNLGGLGYTVAEINVSTGAVEDGENVGGATWTSIQHDGRDGFLIGKADTVARIAADGDFTLTWTRTVTGFTGYQLGAAHGSQASQIGQMSSRVTRLLAVAGGTVKCFDRVGTISVGSGTSAYSSLRPVVFGSQNGARLYIVDGENYKRYNPITNSIENWSASAGSMPASGGDKARLIETWLGCTVLSGISSDPDNWFKSKANDPTNWDYADTTDQGAVAGNNALAGRAPDIVNAMVAITNDRLLFGCDHSLWMLSGNPKAGGRFDQVSSTIGMAWGRPFCIDSHGLLYFFSSRGRVYRMSPSGQMQWISEQIEKRLQNVDLAKTVCRMAWSDEDMGAYLTLTPLDVDKESTHYFFDASTGGWWPDRFKKTQHYPRSIYQFDGDEPGDRVTLLGCNDGYVRCYEAVAEDDDHQPIESEVWIGPVQAKEAVAILEELQGVMSPESGSVEWSVHAAESAQAALKAASRAFGKFAAGRSRSKIVQITGHAVFVRLRNLDLKNAWAIEALRAYVQPIKGQQRVW